MEETKKKPMRKVREGVVVSNKMAKTVTVRVERTVSHPHFDKVISRAKKYYAHADNSQEIAEGKLVRIVETRPLSKLKRWRVLEVLG
ncbi:MAG: 30S ribosomal protein S17 [Chlamydiae bacterium]|nr:30S ribosomal protein S17 [Chlamydiota bacterium]